MTEADIAALLDAHDALLSAWIDGRLSLTEFVASYGTFPEGLPAAESLPSRFRPRRAFHRQVAGIVVGCRRSVEAVGAGEFLEKAAVLRLRQVAERYPEFRTVGE